jgi:hypothetical protein
MLSPALQLTPKQPQKNRQQKNADNAWNNALETATDAPRKHADNEWNNPLEWWRENHKVCTILGRGWG